MQRMSRWEPDASGRLLRAAVELFVEQGFEATTTAQIARRAGLTRTTLFRLFPDKREILFQGQDRLVEVGTEGLRSADDHLDPFHLMARGILAMAAEFGEQQRRLGASLRRLTAASPELQERASFKRAIITRALEDALHERTGDRVTAGLLADVGVRAFYDAFDDWVTSADDDTLADRTRRVLSDRQRTLRQVLSGSG
jgi:AcrR family transcriptional regulator